MVVWQHWIDLKKEPSLAFKVTEQEAVQLDLPGVFINILRLVGAELKIFFYLTHYVGEIQELTTSYTLMYLVPPMER